MRPWAGRGCGRGTNIRRSIPARLPSTGAPCLLPCFLHSWDDQELAAPLECTGMALQDTMNPGRAWWGLLQVGLVPCLPAFLPRCVVLEVLDALLQYGCQHRARLGCCPLYAPSRSQRSMSLMHFPHHACAGHGWGHR